MEKGIITLRLNPYLRGVPNYRRSSKAVRKVKSLLERQKSKAMKNGTT